MWALEREFFMVFPHALSTFLSYTNQETVEEISAISYSLPLFNPPIFVVKFIPKGRIELILSRFYNAKIYTKEQRASI